MIDRLLASKGRDAYSEDYNPQEAVTDQILLNPDAEQLAVVFPMWHGGGFLAKALVNRLAQKQAVLELKFHDQILEPNVERVVQSFGVIKQEVAANLHDLERDAEYKSIHLVGLSLGNVALALVAEEFPSFTSATMVTAGSNLAGSMWEGARTQGVKNGLEDKGVTKQELDEAWQGLAPKNHARAFRNKTVHKIISKRDRIIPTTYQLQMENKLWAAGAQIYSKRNPLGHVATITCFCVRG